MSLTVADFNPLAPEMAVDPYPWYAELRETGGGVHQVGGIGLYVLTRHEDVSAFYKDRRLEMRYAQRETFRYGLDIVEQPFYRYFVQMAHVADNPMHRQLRTMFQAAFTPPRIKAMREHIRAVADRLLDERLPDGGMEFVHDFAEPFPRIVIGEMLGLPPDDNERIGTRILDLGPAFEFLPMNDETQAKVNSSVEYLMDYFRGLAELRLAEPTGDLFSAMLRAAEASDGQISREAVLANTILLYIGGHETTSGACALSLLHLNRNPEQLRRLVDAPGLVPNAAEELLRYDTSAQGTGRIATESVEYGGVEIPEGSMILSYIAAANRDPRVYGDPDALDVGRDASARLVTFGPGPHQCVGHALSRLEVEIFLEVLAERLPVHRLATLEPTFRTFPLLRGILRMEMTW